MMRSLWTAASGMRAQQVNVDTIANNVANINTIGYKSQQASFKSLLYQFSYSCCCHIDKRMGCNVSVRNHNDPVCLH